MNIKIFDGIKRIKSSNVNNKKKIDLIVNKYNNHLDIRLNEMILAFRYYKSLETYDINISSREYNLINYIYKYFITSNNPTLILEAHDYLYTVIKKSINLMTEETFYITDEFEDYKNSWIKSKFNEYIKLPDINFDTLTDLLINDFESNLLKQKTP